MGIGGVSSPPYRYRHGGPCIVAGSAFCLPDDLRRARAIVGDVPVIAVNAAAREVRALFLFSQHAEQFVKRGWVRHQRKKFGDGFTVHSVGHSHVPNVDYWWSIKRSGGSGWNARKVALLVGFDSVVLCGCPLSPGPYVGKHNLGGLMHRVDVVDTLFGQIEADTAWHDGAYSMSGRTRKLLGEPC